jgi:hypothetical protein
VVNRPVYTRQMGLQWPFGVFLRSAELRHCDEVRAAVQPYNAGKISVYLMPYIVVLEQLLGGVP